MLTLTRRPNPPSLARVAAWSLLVALLWLPASSALAQVKGQVRTASTPAWTKGILPISPESYYNAIECGKQGGDDPPCVFWDTGACPNDDFVLAWYTPYKQVAYEVWATMRQKKPAPQPNFQAAQKTRVTIGVTQARGSKNALTDLVVKRAGKSVAPVDRSLSGGGGRFTFDTPAFAASAGVTLDLVGKDRTISCTFDPATMRRMR